MKNQSLKDFVTDWNKSHQYYMSFTPIIAPVTDRPIAIEVRFDPETCIRVAPYKTMFPEDYVQARFFEYVEKPFIYVAPNHDFFERGTFRIEILSCDQKYQESKVIDVLKGIGEEYFGRVLL